MGPLVPPRRGRSGACQRHLGEPTEVIHGVVEVGEEKNPLSRLLDLVLDPAEVSCVVGDGENHGLELAEQPLKFTLGTYARRLRGKASDMELQLHPLKLK